MAVSGLGAQGHGVAQAWDRRCSALASESSRRAQDARAETDHETLVALHNLSVQQLQILKGQDDVLDLLRKALKV